MKKIFFPLIFLLLLAFVSSTGARMTLPILGGGGAGCTIGDPDSTGTHEVYDTQIDLYSYNARGQGFQVSTTGDLARICIYVIHNSNATVEMRIDDDTDLGDAPIEDLGESATMTADGWACVDSTTNPELSGSTTYYIAARTGTPDSDTALDWRCEDTTPSYASGAAYNVSSEWAIGATQTRDFNFRVYLCE